MENKENQNYEPKIFHGIDLIRESFIPKLIYPLNGRVFYLKFNNNPYFLRKGVEYEVTHGRGYTLPNKKNGKEISEKELMRYFKFKDKLKLKRKDKWNNDIIFELFYELIRHDIGMSNIKENLDKISNSMKELPTKEAFNSIVNYWKGEAESYKELYFKELGIKPKKENSAKPKKSLIKRIFSLAN